MKQAYLNIIIFIFVAALSLGSVQGHAGNLLGQEKKLLGYTKDNWVHFRDYEGRQLIYFTHLEVYRCGLKQVMYSLNSDDLDREWKLDPCDVKNPHEINASPDNLPYISLPLGTAKSISIRLTFSDGSKSDIIRLKPKN